LVVSWQGLGGGLPSWIRGGLRFQRFQHCKASPKLPVFQRFQRFQTDAKTPSRGSGDPLVTLDPKPSSPPHHWEMSASDAKGHLETTQQQLATVLSLLDVDTAQQPGLAADVLNELLRCAPSDPADMRGAVLTAAANCSHDQCRIEPLVPKRSSAGPLVEKDYRQTEIAPMGPMLDWCVPRPKTPRPVFMTAASPVAFVCAAPWLLWLRIVRHSLWVRASCAYVPVIDAPNPAAHLILSAVTALQACAVEGHSRVAYGGVATAICRRDGCSLSCRAV
jgi:hypothetical protein